MTLNATTCDLPAVPMPRALPAGQPLTKRSFKAVVFDLDDTLYAERDYALSGFRATERYLQAMFNVSAYNDLVENYVAAEPAATLAQVLSRRFKDAQASFISNVIHVFWAHRPRIALYPDARVALSLLFQRGIATAAVTVGPAGVQERKILALGLDELLDTVTHSDALLTPAAPGRTCPDAFEVTALLLGVEPQDMLFVGDNPLADFLVPRQLGITTVRIRRKHGTHSTDEPPSAAHAPDYTLPSLDMLVEQMQADYSTISAAPHVMQDAAV